MGRDSFYPRSILLGVMVDWWDLEAEESEHNIGGGKRMNADEFASKLQRMTPEEKAAFKHRTGAPDGGDQRWVDEFVTNPAWEKRFCHHLGMPTEGERISKSTHKA